MKKAITILTVLFLLVGMICPVSAEDNSRSYEFDLTVNGQHEISAEPGDTLTVTLKLLRTDSQDAADIYSMQDEIRYDDEFLALVDAGTLTAKEIETKDLQLIDGNRMLYMNFASFSGGESWESDKLIATFQIKVIAESGSTVLKNENCSVATQDGSDSFHYTVQDLRIRIKGDDAETPDPKNGEGSGNGPDGQRNTKGGSDEKAGLPVWVIPLVIAIIAVIIILIIVRKKRK